MRGRRTCYEYAHAGAMRVEYRARCECARDAPGTIVAPLSVAPPYLAQLGLPLYDPSTAIVRRSHMRMWSSPTDVDSTTSVTVMAAERDQFSQESAETWPQLEVLCLLLAIAVQMLGLTYGADKVRSRAEMFT